jgi:DNA repair protein RadC
MNNLSIKKWSEEDRPREKLLRHGVRVLSDAELIALLISSGTRELSAVELARKILAESSNNLTVLAKQSAHDLMKIKGIGKAKAISIVAALELGRRRKESDPPAKPAVRSSKDAACLFTDILTDISHEEFWVAFLSRSNQLIERAKISQGGISGTVTDVKLIMRKAIELLSSSLIVCHNHPSGNLQPSSEDRQITIKIQEACQLFDIKVLDHIIIGGNSYFSFADEGII